MEDNENDIEQQLLDQMKKLQETVDALKAVDLDALTSSRVGRTTKRKKSATPDWVVEWNRRNAATGAVKHVVVTDESGATTKLEPVVLPEHLKLGVLHDSVEPPINWADRPTDDAVAPRGLDKAERVAWHAANPGNPLELRDEGPTKPVRKQMVALNKVWKYRNFKKCGNCEAYDTYESRTDPYAEQFGVRQTHAEIWCMTCGAVEYEVSDAPPNHIGSWAPLKESEKELKLKAERRKYRWERAIYSLVEKPKTPGELCIWFREVEQYEAVDFPMMEIQLNQMKKAGLVVLSDGLWWEAQNYAFEKGAKK